MYVIFPADELICMTYGVAVPRFKPRPTLDNLREPLVPITPIGTRPSPSRNVLAEEPQSVVSAPQQPLPPPPATSSRTTTPRSSTKTKPVSQSNSLRRGSKQAGRNRERTPLRSAANYEQLNAEDEVISDPAIDYLNDETDYYFERDRSPSEFFETAASYPVLLPPSHVIVTNNLSPKVEKKQKKGLHIKLGRLGRQPSDHIETHRIREDQNILVSNPTFTRENLRQRNYDAFFESGEPVYSIENRWTKEAELLEQSASETNQPSVDEKRHSHHFFHHSLGGGQSSRSAKGIATAPNSPNLPNHHHFPRAQTVDPERSLEVSLKGDRILKRSS